MDKRTQVQPWAKTALRVLAYLLAVLLVFLTFSVLCAADTVTISSDLPGEADLRDFDFAERIAEITNGSDTTYRYPGAFYTSEDFASGSVTQAGALTGDKGDYGTLRILLHLPQDGIYAISGKSVAYAQTIFVDGVEIGSVGVPADNPEDHTPMNSRFMEAFSAGGETTEIIIHYSVFIHADGGGVHPIQIGTVANIARAEQLRTLFEGVLATALFTAMLFFFGLFLFFGSRRYFLWFALLCGCVAGLCLGLNNNALLLLLPDISFTVFLRLGYIGTCWAGLFGALYINGLFPGAVNRRAVRGFVLYCAAVTLFIALAPTTLFTRYPVQLAATYVAFLVYQLLAVLLAARRGALNAVMTKTEGALLLGGMALYIFFGAVDIWSHQHSVRLFGWEYLLVGVMVFLFLNILALALIFARTERALDAAQAAEREMAETNRMLERLGRLRADVMATISHEMKTPLTVIKGNAQLTLQQIDDGEVDEETRENLRIASSEAQRLADLAGELLHTEVEVKVWERELLDSPELLRQAAAVCRPILARGGNRIDIQAADGLPPVWANGAMLHQVLLNLITNAGRHMQGGTVTLSALPLEESGRQFIQFTVADNGGGIDPALLSHVFERRVSGDAGSGLGLPICKDIIKDHGGRVSIDSAPGEGTRVMFTLPAEKGGESDAKHSDD